MKEQLSFADVSLLTEDIAEITVHPNIEISLEMVEEYDNFLENTFPKPFALLINRMNRYDYSFEAKVSIASQESLSAIAVIIYDKQGESSTHSVFSLRERDGWNLKTFNGLNSGWSEGYEWLKLELKTVSV